MKSTRQSYVSLNTAMEMVNQDTASPFMEWEVREIARKLGDRKKALMYDEGNEKILLLWADLSPTTDGWLETIRLGGGVHLDRGV